jgi:hypothetical protein
MVVVSPQILSTPSGGSPASVKNGVAQSSVKISKKPSTLPSAEL